MATLEDAAREAAARADDFIGQLRNTGAAMQAAAERLQRPPSVKIKRTFLIGVPPNLAEIVRQAVFNKQTFRPQTFGPIASPGLRSTIVDALIAALNEARQHPRPPGQRPT